VGKIVIWSLAVLFGYVCIRLVMGVILVQSLTRKMAESMPRGEGSTHIYETGCTICPGIALPFHPHAWAAMLVGLGLCLVVIGLVFLLHVPVKDPL
jgi:hypothetical protein